MTATMPRNASSEARESFLEGLGYLLSLRHVTQGFLHGGQTGILPFLHSFQRTVHHPIVEFQDERAVVDFRELFFLLIAGIFLGFYYEIFPEKNKAK